MNLNLSIAGKVVASTPIASYLPADDYYLKAFRRLLVIRHQAEIKKVQKEPLFFLEQSAGKQQTIR